jgi:hypothetical protein
MRRGTTVKLQKLFAAPIIEQHYLDPGYSGHASDVWHVVCHVATTQEEVVVRAVRQQGEFDGPFWQGCSFLFGLDSRNIFDLELINTLLARVCPIPIPQVLSKGIVDERPYVIVEYMPGFPLNNFSSLPESALEEFGRALAHIHSYRFDYFGHVTGRLRFPLAAFQERLVETMSMLVEQFYQNDAQIKAALPSFCEDALLLPSVEDGALIMVDMDPTQFLTDGERLTALVDTEAYGVGPRELDFVALEYVLTSHEAVALARGYSAILPVPDLSVVRPVYRYLYRLIEIQGRMPLETWMGWPVFF